jgi:hypothetical protein
VKASLKCWFLWRHTPSRYFETPLLRLSHCCAALSSRHCCRGIAFTALLSRCCCRGIAVEALLSRHRFHSIAFTVLFYITALLSRDWVYSITVEASLSRHFEACWGMAFRALLWNNYFCCCGNPSQALAAKAYINIFVMVFFRNFSTALLVLPSAAVWCALHLFPSWWEPMLWNFLHRNSFSWGRF